MKNEKRIEWIDAARGIGILLVILGHSYMVLGSEANRLILSFHMPLFFFLSGFCTKNSIVDKPWKEYIIGKIQTLLVPQFVLGVIYFTWSMVFEKSNLVDMVITSFTNWFLIVLFMVNMLHYSILKTGIKIEMGETVRKLR